MASTADIHHGQLQARVPMSSREFRPDYTILRAVVCPLCGEQARAARLSGARPADLCGLLRHQAAGRDQLSGRLRRTSPPRASIRRRPPCASSSATSALLVQLHARPQRAAVAAVLPDQQRSSRATSRRSCSRSSTTTWPRPRRRWPRTFETAARGVIYEHRPASLPAERLATALKPMLAEAGAGRRIGVRARRGRRAAARRGRRARADSAPSRDNRRAFLELLGRVITSRAGRRSGRRTRRADALALIVP